MLAHSDEFAQLLFFVVAVIPKSILIFHELVSLSVRGFIGEMLGPGVKVFNYRFNFLIEFYLDKKKYQTRITIRFSFTPLITPRRSQYILDI